jgi:hypothetical protein
MRRLVVSFLVVLGVTGLWPGVETALGAPSASGDFNGDGRADLAVGDPSEDVGTAN